MTVETDSITTQEQTAYLGLDGENLKRLIIPNVMQNSTIDRVNSKQDIFNSITQIVEHKHPKTVLEQCLEYQKVSDLKDTYTAVIYDEKPDITVAVMHDTLMMKLFPPKSVTFDEQELELPLFEIELTMSQINKKTLSEDIANSLLYALKSFEGEFLFELLGKAVRSQRNKIDKPLDEDSISEALELIERENYEPSYILANSKAFSIIRKTLDNNNCYQNIPVLQFSPNSRMNKNRTYFMGPTSVLGKITKSSANIQIEENDNHFNISYLYRLGAVILNRNLISVIEH